MLKLVLSPSRGAMLEATRVYGNLSLSKDVRDFIMHNKGIQLLSREKRVAALEPSRRCAHSFAENSHLCTLFSTYTPSPSPVHQFVVALLDSKCAETCFSASGVLTNLALDPPNRVCLSLEGASAK